MKQEQDDFHHELQEKKKRLDRELQDQAKALGSWQTHRFPFNHGRFLA